MADYMTEIEFTLAEPYLRNVELLESIGIHLEEIAGYAGPSAAIHGDRYSVTLIAESPSPLEAGKLASAITVEAVNMALAERDDELEEGAFEMLMDRLLVEHADVAELALA
jgi:hypothetical protein